MEDRNGSGGIDGYRRKRCPALGIAAGGTRKSIQRLSLIIGLDPGAHIQRGAAADAAFKNRFVGHQYLGAALGQDAAHFAQGELGVQRHRDSARADDPEEPMKAAPVVRAINGDELAGTERDRPAEKGIDAADVGVQLGKMKCSVVSNGDFAIPFSPQQLIDKIGHCDAAVARELIAAEDVHQATTGLRPQSLATQ